MNPILNIKTYLKFLSRNKAYTLITVFGLAISMMFVVLIALYTSEELSTDTFHAKGDRIYALGNEDNAVSALPIGFRLQQRYPEIEEVCPVTMSNSNNWVVKIEDNRVLCTPNFTMPSFFTMFSFPLSDKYQFSHDNPMTDKFSVVISESFAARAFGSDNPIGKSIRISDSTNVVVSAVMKDVRNSVIPYTDILLHSERQSEFNPYVTMDSDNSASSVTTFLLIKKGADLTTKIPDIMAYFKESYWTYKLDIWKEVSLTQLPELYFSKYSPKGGNSGNRLFVVILLSVGVAILLFAVLNYINLTVAQGSQRAKEMATRRLLGSSRKDIFLRLIGESVMLTFVSFSIGMFLALALMPYANELLQSPMDIKDLLHPVWVGSMFGLIFIVGIVTGLIPAVMISSPKPIEVVRGTFRRQSKMVFGKIFITFQNAITIIMIVAALVMIFQLRHLINAPLGVRTENLLETRLNYENDAQRNAVTSQWRELPNVKRVGFTEGMPFSGTNNITAQYNGHNISMQQYKMDSTMFNMLGIETIRDNKVAIKDGWFLSEQAMVEMDLPQDAPSFTVDKQSFPIRGILKNFSSRGNILQNMEPIMLQILPPDEVFPFFIVLEVTGNAKDAYTAIKNVYEKTTSLAFEAEFVDEQLQESFADQIRLVKIVIIFAFIAILISMLGLVAMSTYYIRQRAQEISIRKVFGSDNGGILLRLLSTFILYVILSAVVALPVSWYLMRDWLMDYSYRISLNPLFFAGGILFCIILSVMAVIFQSYIAANQNPIKNLKQG